MGGYGIDHVSVSEGLGCKAIRVRSRNELREAFARACALMAEHRVTNVATGTEIHSFNEFEEILCLDPSLTVDDPGSVLNTGSAPFAERAARSRLTPGSDVAAELADLVMAMPFRARTRD